MLLLRAGRARHRQREARLPCSSPCAQRGAAAAVRAGLAAGAPAGTGSSHVAPATIAQYSALTKPRVVALIVFTAIVGMFLAVPGLPPWRGAMFGRSASGLAAAAPRRRSTTCSTSASTRRWRAPRPAAADGQLIAPGAGVRAGAGRRCRCSMLVVLVNTLTAVLTFASLIGYAVVYTVWLKRATPQNIVIGGIAGAAPPLLGWAAVTGMQGVGLGLRAAAGADHLRVDAAAFLGAGDLPPRRLRQGDGADAAGDPRRGLHALADPVLHGAAGAGDAAAATRRHERHFYLGGALVLGVVFLWHAWKLMIRRTICTRCRCSTTRSCT